MVNLPVLRLVCSNHHQDIPHVRIRLQVEVANRDVRGLEVCPFWNHPVFKIGDRTGVGDHGLFLDIPDEAVACAWRDEVREEKGVKKDTLATEDHHSHEPTRLPEVKEGEKVETLVISLLEKSLDPGVVPLEAAD